MPTKPQLREHFRTQRQRLNQEEQKAAAVSLANHFIYELLFHSSQHIACYPANDGELDVNHIIKAIWHANKTCYLPCLREGSTLAFMPHHPHDRLKANKYGIYEPDYDVNKAISPEALDLVLLPLVAFDMHGHRLGMGGGYYDRTFAFKKNQTKPQKPWLVGVAHHCQTYGSLPHDDWDVGLDFIATEKEIIKPKKTLVIHNG
ncbi:MAG: 5-formyltetrahydrofolate cyclo-ligase [Gammaproteobacteria bacterium]